MIATGFKGIVDITIERNNGQVERQVHNNMLLQPLYFAHGLDPQDDNDGGARPLMGIKEIIFGSGSVPPVIYQTVADMTPILYKPIVSWGGAGGLIQTSNLGNLYPIWAGKFELLNAEGNGSTIRELALVYHEQSASLIKTLFARIVRAPIVKTSSMKLTVKWYICMPDPATAPVPVVTFIPPAILP